MDCWFHLVFVDILLFMGLVCVYVNMNLLLRLLWSKPYFLFAMANLYFLATMALIIICIYILYNLYIT
jgi:hypothetical protein